MWRRESREAELRDKDLATIVAPLREAAEIHRRVRLWARAWVRPGMRLLDIADGIEEALRRTAGTHGGLARGIAFPTGLSVNHIAAHWTPNADDAAAVLRAGDVLKVDMGVHVRGRVVDSAFTLAWDPAYDALLETVRAATDAAVAAAGVDVRLADIGPVVEEVMAAGEVTVHGRTHAVRTVRNLMGHSLGLYRIHGGKCVPTAAGVHARGRMEEGDVLAFETFGSTGRGHATDEGTGLPTSHYMRAPHLPTHALSSGSGNGSARARGLLAHIDSNYGTLAFARRWLDQTGVHDYARTLQHLVDIGAVDDYPPLCDVPGSVVAQFEHTVVIKPSSKEVVSRGPDY